MAEPDHVRRGEWMQFSQSVNRRLEEHANRLKEVGDRTHKIPSLEMGLDFTRQRLIEVMEDMKGMPRKEDLNNITQALTTRLDNQDKAAAKSTSDMRWFIGIALILGAPIISALALAALKKLGLL